MIKRRYFAKGNWPRMVKAAIAMAALAVGIITSIFDVGVPLEQMLANQRAALRSGPASQHYVFIELDAQSLAAVEAWPWPRRRYAEAIERLNRAGVGTIGFDVDFSATSNPVDDSLFAQAIARSRAPVILPTFRQAASERSQREVENLPIPAFRSHSQMAAVNIFTERDGAVRHYPYGVVTGGTPRPSMGATLANVAGRANDSFPIDYAIDPKTVPHISFIDLLRGRFDPALVRGRSVLIGASAVELGDRYATPRDGVLPGPLIQLLAAETLTAGSAPVDHGPVVPLLIGAAALSLGWRLRRRFAVITLASTALFLLALPLALESFKLGTLSIVPALFALITAMAMIAARTALATFRQLLLFDQDSGLPNRKALLMQERPAQLRELLVLRIGNYGNVVGAAGQEAATQLISKVADRVRLLGLGRIYRTQADLLVFPVDKSDPESLVGRVETMVAILRPRVEIAGRQIEIQSSIGVADASKGDMELLLDHAILAAEHAASTGCRWEVYCSELEDAESWRLDMARELDVALEAGNLHLVYQPKFNIREGQVTAVEALVRWNHPTRGPISPDSFIPVLEEIGRIDDLTMFVARRAIEDCARWLAGGVRINVAINISAALLADKSFLEALRQLISKAPIPPSMLTLEVTETATLGDAAVARAAMESLAELGLRLSIDDYGTGQSTLSYLKQLPARELKIDKSFIQGLETSTADQAMVRSTIGLAHELGYSVVAEGVETEAILQLLRQYGCHYAQGWHISRPLLPEQLLAFVGEHRKAA